MIIESSSSLLIERSIYVANIISGILYGDFYKLVPLFFTYMKHRCTRVYGLSVLSPSEEL